MFLVMTLAHACDEVSRHLCAVHDVTAGVELEVTVVAEDCQDVLGFSLRRKKEGLSGRSWFFFAQKKRRRHVATISWV